MGAPLRLSYTGKNAMLLTQASPEDLGLPPPSGIVTTRNGSSDGRSIAGSSYASAIGSPSEDCEIVDVGDGNGNGGSEGWASSAVAASSPM